MASTAGDPTISDLRPSFGFDDLIKCIAMWAIEMKRRVFGHGTPDPFSPKVHYSKPQTPGHRRAGIIRLLDRPRRRGAAAGMGAMIAVERTSGHARVSTGPSAGA